MRSNPIDEITDFIPSTTNQHGQRVGMPVREWQAAPRPQRRTLEGQYCRLVPLEPEIHASELFELTCVSGDESTWTYMHYGPFSSLKAFHRWTTDYCTTGDRLFYAIIAREDGRPRGFACYQRIDPDNGSIEVGNVYYGPSLRRTAAATEAMYLMMREAFCTGYRRYEWKLDALNVPSHKAARRFGFTFEGTFRQGHVYKGRNRDISWYSMLDSEWDWLQRAYEEWLNPHNFDRNGGQRSSLEECILRSSPLPAQSAADRGWLI